LLAHTALTPIPCHPSCKVDLTQIRDRYPRWSDESPPKTFIRPFIGPTRSCPRRTNPGQFPWTESGPQKDSPHEPGTSKTLHTCWPRVPKSKLVQTSTQTAKKLEQLRPGRVPPRRSGSSQRPAQLQETSALGLAPQTLETPPEEEGWQRKEFFRAARNLRRPVAVAARAT